MYLSIQIITACVITVTSRILQQNEENMFDDMIDSKSENTSIEFVAMDYADSDDIVFPKKSIFFIQSVFNSSLDCRQACSVESAALIHKHFQVNLLFSGPVTKEIMNTRPLAALAEYDNIKFFRVRVAEYVKGMLLDPNDAECLVNHSAPSLDVLKYLTLYKFPGIFLDLDILVLKRLDEVPDANWVGQEDDDEMNDGILSFSDDEVGRQMANISLSVLEDQLNDGEQNRPEIVQRALDSVCSASPLSGLSQRICEGFKVYTKKYFYRITMNNYVKYFGSGLLNMTNIYTIRVRNRPVTSNSSNEKEILQYVTISRNYCPKVHKSCYVHHSTNFRRTKVDVTKVSRKLSNPSPSPEGTTEDCVKSDPKLLDLRDGEEIVKEDEFWETDDLHQTF